MFNYPVHEGGLYGVVCGPMKSGKSEEIISLYNKLQYTDRINVGVYKHILDDRDGPRVIRSHGGLEIPCTNFTQVEELYHRTRKNDLVLVDEAQFIKPEHGDIVAVVNELCLENKHIILFGLDLDRKKLPFNAMPDLLLHADYVNKISGFCDDCHRPSRYSKLISEDTGEQILTGGSDKYKTVCRRCY